MRCFTDIEDFSIMHFSVPSIGIFCDGLTSIGEFGKSLEKRCEKTSYISRSMLISANRWSYFGMVHYCYYYYFYYYYY